jgi:hypothetical protein
VSSADEVIAYLDANIEPDVWDSIARFEEGEWRQTFRAAPLPSFNTLTELVSRETYWLFVTEEAVLH